jgi:RNA-binding motif protein, X-linked 2
VSLTCSDNDPDSPYGRWGEIADIDMPRDKSTGKRRGFAFLMYEDQRSTVLAVDNMNGAQLLGRTLRVDHVQNYKQKELVDGKWVDRETERLNVRPELVGKSSQPL